MSRISTNQRCKLWISGLWARRCRVPETLVALRILRSWMMLTRSFWSSTTPQASDNFRGRVRWLILPVGRRGVKTRDCHRLMTRWTRCQHLTKWRPHCRRWAISRTTFQIDTNDFRKLLLNLLKVTPKGRSLSLFQCRYTIFFKPKFGRSRVPRGYGSACHSCRPCRSYGSASIVSKEIYRFRLYVEVLPSWKPICLLTLGSLF